MSGKVLVTGGVTHDMLIYLDEFPQPVGQTLFSKGYHEAIGGTGAGKALNLNRLGLDVTFHAMLGEDTPGQLIQSQFAAENLKFIYDVDPRGTERHINLMADNGERISIYTHYATFEPEFNLKQIAPYIRLSDVVVLNIINYCRHLIPLIKVNSKPIWCDIHNYDGEKPYHRDFVEAADYLFLSSEALPDYRGFMEQQIAAGKKLVVCTHGKHGSTALTEQGEWLETPIIEGIKVRDTNGAGDSFFAGVLYGHLHQYPLRISLQLGALVAALCVQSSELFHPDLSAAFLQSEYQRVYGTVLP